MQAARAAIAQSLSWLAALPAAPVEREAAGPEAASPGRLRPP
jgi:hypothetical protein